MNKILVFVFSGFFVVLLLMEYIFCHEVVAGVFERLGEKFNFFFSYLATLKNKPVVGFLGLILAMVCWRLGDLDAFLG